MQQLELFEMDQRSDIEKLKDEWARTRKALFMQLSEQKKINSELSHKFALLEMHICRGENTCMTMLSGEGIYLVNNSQKCIVCGQNTSVGLSYHNSDKKYFKYMEIGECAHQECYIDLCVQKSLEKFKEKQQ